MAPSLLLIGTLAAFLCSPFVAASYSGKQCYTSSPCSSSDVQSLMSPSGDSSDGGPGSPGGQGPPSGLSFRIATGGVSDPVGCANVAAALKASPATPITCVIDCAVPSKSSKKGKRSVGHGHSKAKSSSSKGSKTASGTKQVKTATKAVKTQCKSAGLSTGLGCTYIALNCSSVASSSASSPGSFGSSKKANVNYVKQVGNACKKQKASFVIMTNQAAWTAGTGNTPKVNKMSPISTCSLIVNQASSSNSSSQNSSSSSFTPFGPWKTAIAVQVQVNVNIYFGNSSCVGNILVPSSPKAPASNNSVQSISPPSNSCGFSYGLGCVLVPGGGTVNSSSPSTGSSSLATSTSSSTSTSTSSSSSISSSSSTSSSSGSSTGSTAGTGSTGSTGSTASPSTSSSSIASSSSSGSSSSSVSPSSTTSLSTVSSPGSSGSCLAPPTILGSCSSVSGASYPLSFFVSVTIINPVIVLPVAQLSCQAGPAVPCVCSSSGTCYAGTPGTQVSFYPYCGAASSSNSNTGCPTYAYITNPGGVLSSSCSCSSGGSSSSNSTSSSGASSVYSQGNQDASDFTMNTLQAIYATCVSTPAVCLSATAPQYTGPVKSSS